MGYHNTVDARWGETEKLKLAFKLRHEKTRPRKIRDGLKVRLGSRRFASS
jgi:hypothetical protein